MNIEKEIKKKILKSDFAVNNGRIIRTINVMQGEFVSLKSVEEVISEYMDAGNFKKCLTYLYKACFVEIRTKIGKKILKDINKLFYDEMEIALTQKGIKLAMGYIDDEAVDM